MDRKLLYRVLIKFMVIIGFTFIIYTFTADFISNREKLDSDDSIKVDVGPLKTGQDMRVRWDGKGIIIIRRSPETQRLLRESDKDLADPYSRQSHQPEGTEHPLRSLNDEYLVAWLPKLEAGCSMDFEPPSLGKPGRLVNSCSGQSYDLAGRALLQGVNLDIPQYRWLSPELLVILR
jgi:Rieske Fe-S protein